METVNIQQTTEQQNEEVSFAEIFFHYISYWKWFVASVAVCLIIAFVYLRYTTAEYLVSSHVLIKDDQKGKAATFDVNAFNDLGLFPQVGTFDNEIEVLLSKTLMKSVSDSLKLNVAYYSNGRLKQFELYKNSPVYVSITNQIDWGSFVLQKNDDGSFFMKSKSHKYEKQFALNDTVNSPWGLLTFKENPFGNAEYPVEVVIKHPKSLPGVSVAPLNKLTTVVDVSMITATPQKGLDIINTLVAEYNQRAINEKNYVANHTIDFINERLVDISGELKTAEQNVESYKKVHGLSDLAAEAQMSLSSQTEYTKKSVEVATQLNILRSVKSFLTNPENKNNIAPSNVGLTDPTVISLINKYNEEVLAKTRQAGLKESNPMIQAINERITLLRDELIKGITMAESGMQTTLRSVEQQANAYLSKTMSLSTQERESRELYRQKEIKESLFIYLLQKKEETGLSLALATPNAVVIDEADYYPVPVKPKGNIILLAALLLGLIIPVAVIYVLDLFDNKVRNKEQLTQIVKAPFLGEVPQTKSTKFPVLNVRSGIAEKFRIIASNLGFVVSGDKQKVIMVTSTYSGDGKSFFSQNLAMSLATSGYKTLLIDLDMRKSVLNKTLSINPSKGVAMFLSDPTIKLEQIIDKTGTFHKNLDIIPIKVFPPNPAELFSSARLEELFRSLSSEYDYVIVDTAPIGLVADAFRINQFADATIYVTRIDYTYKSSLCEIQHLYREQKLKNMTVILNAVPTSNFAYGNDRKKNNYYTYDD
ncbi:tyrosine protein kinase [Bacteroidia bacterium]|nr:tyrosine protein kinase [Bacteroidia bacterium]